MGKELMPQGHNQGVPMFEFRWNNSLTELSNWLVVRERSSLDANQANAHRVVFQGPPMV